METYSADEQGERAAVLAILEKWTDALLNNHPPLMEGSFTGHARDRTILGTVIALQKYHSGILTSNETLNAIKKCFGTTSWDLSGKPLD